MLSQIVNYIYKNTNYYFLCFLRKFKIRHQFEHFFLSLNDTFSVIFPRKMHKGNKKWQLSVVFPNTNTKKNIFRKTSTSLFLILILRYIQIKFLRNFHTLQAV
jgi:hypothetical protein